MTIENQIRCAHIKFYESTKDDQPITKFGGQPFMLSKLEWPRSKATGRQMQFICQIFLDDKLFIDSDGKIIYVFMTDGDDAENTWNPESGENAVIIKSIRDNDCKRASSDVQGPTLENEYKVELDYTTEPACLPEVTGAEWDDEQYMEYYDAIEGNKIGGTPLFIQGEEFSKQDGWELLLQLDSTQVPFEINFGDAGVGYVFINKNYTEGKFLWQCY